MDLDDNRNRPMFKIGETVKSGVLVVPYRRLMLDQLLNRLEEDGKQEFAIDLVIIDDRVSLDSEARNFRRKRSWNLPAQGTEELDACLELARNVFEKTTEELTANTYGEYKRSKCYRFSLELTHQKAGTKPRQYDSVPHIDALLPYQQDPVTEILWSNKESSVIYAGEYIWNDTTAERVPIKGLKRLIIPSEHLEIGRGGTLVHSAPPTTNKRWLLRGFLEPVGLKLANYSRYGFDEVLGLGTSPLSISR